MIGSRAALASLLEVLEVAIDRVKAAGDRPWESGPVALSWMEHEIAPLVARLLRIGLPSPCPICREGEEFDVYPPSVEIWRRRPLGESYTCGHWVRFSVSVLHEADYDVLMPMNSTISIPPNASAQITSRPQAGSFRPVRIVLGGHPDRWQIDDIRVGCRSQFAQSGSIPGALFSSSAVDPPALRIDVLMTSMDFVLVVRYVGPLPEGEPFEAVVLGVTVGGEAERETDRPGEGQVLRALSTDQAAAIVERVRARMLAPRVPQVDEGDER